MSEEPQTDIVVSGGGGKPKFHITVPVVLKKILIVIACLVVCAAVVAAGMRIRFNMTAKNAAFVVGNKAYSKAFVNEMVKYAGETRSAPNLQQQLNSLVLGKSTQTQPTKNSLDKAAKNVVAKQIYEMYRTQAAAKKAGIIPNSQEMSAVSSTQAASKPETKAQKSYSEVLNFVDALPKAYDRYESGDYQGDLFVFNFSDKILPTPANEPPLAGHGDQKLIEQDDDYALEQAQDYYSQYKNDHASVDSINKELQSKLKAGFNGAALTFDSRKSITLKDQINYEDAYKYITAQSKPILSGIRTGRVATSLRPQSDDFADGYHYFVKINRAQRGVSNPKGKVESAKKELKAEFHGI